MNISSFASLAIALVIALQGTSAYAASAKKTIVPGAHRVHMLSYETGLTCASLAPILKMTFVYDTSLEAVGIRTVYATVEGKRIGARKTINTNDRTVTLSFPRSANIGICSGKTIDVLADFSRNAQKDSTHRLYVELATDVITDEGIGGAPQMGEWITVQ